MTTIAFENGRFARDGRGNFVLRSGLSYAKQRIVEFLKTTSGEWFLNRSYGLPYANTHIAYTFVNAVLTGTEGTEIRQGDTAIALVQDGSVTFQSVEDAAIENEVAIVRFESNQLVDLPSNTRWIPPSNPRTR